MNRPRTVARRWHRMALKRLAFDRKTELVARRLHANLARSWER